MSSVGEAVVDRGHGGVFASGGVGAQILHCAPMGATRHRRAARRRCALAWLAGVALQLQQRALWPLGGLRRARRLAGVLVRRAGAARWRRGRSRLRARRGAGVRSASRLPGWRAVAAAGRALPRRARRPRPRRHRRRRQPAAARPERAALSLRGRARRARGEPVRCRRVLALGWYARLPRRRGAGAAAARAARRPALALHGAPAPAARQPQPARLRLRAVRCSSRACAPPATCATRRAASCSTRAPATRSSACASACATRSTRSVADRRAAGVLAALAVGDQGAIERDDWDLFRNTGVAHLMSISGLHVTMFAWLAGAADRRGCGGAARGRCAGCRRRARRAGAASRAATAYALLRRLGRAGAAHGLDARDRDAAAGAAALRWPWPLVLLARGGRGHARSTRGRCCSRASGCRSSRSAC